MLIAADGSSKQRGHGQAAGDSRFDGDALFPSGSAALYRREMLDQIGAFDESFFLYCEDIDLGLRARWAGWECRYVAGAVVEHRYSHSAGRASALKAYYVERNRLYTVIKNFPCARCWRAPWAALARYFWHLISMLTGRGKAAEFRDGGQSRARCCRFWFCARMWPRCAPAAPAAGAPEDFRIPADLPPHEFAQLLRRHCHFVAPGGHAVRRGERSC